MTPLPDIFHASRLPRPRRTRLACLAAVAAALLWPELSMALVLDGTRDVEYLCAHSTPLTMPWTSGNRGSASPGAMPEPGDCDASPVQCASPVIQAAFTSIAQDVEGADAAPRREDVRADEEHGDAVVAALRARGYARQRGNLLLQVHEVTVDAADLLSQGYRPELGAILLDAEPGIPLFGGHHMLEAGDDTTLVFPAEAHHAEQLETLRELGSLSVRILFALPVEGSPDTEFCVRRPDGSLSLRAEVLAAELVESLTQRVWSHFETAEFATLESHLGERPGGETELARPEVVVSRVSSEGRHACGSDTALWLRTVFETELTGCYVVGLRENAASLGALVIEFTKDEDGALHSATIAVDALNDATIIECVLREIESLRLPPAVAAGPLDFRATVAFRQQ